MTLADLSLVGLIFLAPVSAIIFSFFRLGSPALRRVMGLAAPLSLMCFFVCCINPSVGDRMTLIVPGLFELNQVGAYCGILFNGSSTDLVGNFC